MVLPLVSPFEELLIALFPDELDGLPAFPAGIALRVPFLNDLTGLPFRAIGTCLILLIPETAQLDLALRPVDVTSPIFIAQLTSVAVLVL
ncbi:hypothetical protein LI82_10725 [Methanococcoides methylutens]|uniref:Uncharacterized protein n=1 Tax=Methanococcoides methylutens TaxID=2226 RepID=A0A099SZ68_METMT|nr:hypothetical protein LI82_10725 [Methanococcoides methylutens]